MLQSQWEQLSHMYSRFFSVLFPSLNTISSVLIIICTIIITDIIIINIIITKKLETTQEWKLFQRNLSKENFANVHVSSQFVGTKKIPGFSWMLSILNLLYFGCFDAGQHVDGCFLLI